jgi:hypothetical protein
VNPRVDSGDFIVLMLIAMTLLRLTHEAG